jgi:hypothetical protein
MPDQLLMIVALDIPALIRITSAPILIGLISLAERKWGSAVSGTLIGLPTVSGPLLFCLAFEHGAAFAAHAAVGTLLGLVALGAFALTYAWVAQSRGWGSSLFAATVSYAVVSSLLLKQPLKAAGLIILLTSCLLVIALVSFPAGVHSSESNSGWRELIFRMIAAAVLVFGLVAAARALGPEISGSLATFPVYTSIVAVFNHKKNCASAVTVLKGVVAGSLGTTGFLSVLALGLGRLPIALCFPLAIIAALLVQALLYPCLRQAPANASSTEERDALFPNIHPSSSAERLVSHSREHRS